MKLIHKAAPLWVVLAIFAMFGAPLAAQSGVETPHQDTEASSSPATGESSSTSDAGSSSSSQDDVASDQSATALGACDLSTVKTCVKDFFGDQAGIWTSPLRLHAQDALWLAPLAAAIGVSLHYDAQTLQQVSKTSNGVQFSNDFSNAGVYGAIGAAGASYLFGKFTKNEKARETGVLSLEAIADAGVVTEVLKLVTNRERPYVGTGQGHFWPDGTNVYSADGSFPSGHATIIWAFSHVVADETPGHRWWHLGLYALATGVSVARVTSRNHFPSDVVAGSAIGYLTGGYVYRRHSDSYDNSRQQDAFTISPVYDPLTRAYGIGVTIDPGALRGASLKGVWNEASLIAGHSLKAQ